MSQWGGIIVVAAQMLPRLASLTEDQIICLTLGAAYTVYDEADWVFLFGVSNTTESDLAVGTDQVEYLWILGKNCDRPRDAVVTFTTCSIHTDEVSQEH
jgi:hypothetical protein